MSVQDNGIGITPEMAVSVFDLFTQAKRSTNGVMGGLGLGLALVKSVVEAHGGKVSVYSLGLNHGSTFGVTLPRHEAPHAAVQESIRPLALPILVQPDKTAAPVADGQSLDILLVEDNQDAAQTLAMMLEFAGHRVVIAYNGKEALQQAAEKRFDGAILDIGLPDTDGYTLARKFKAMPQLGATRLVALTGYGSAEDKAKAREAGFDQHITKPIIDCDMLIGALQPANQRTAPALTT
jgi:CheY-like chemotaxis protein